MKTTRSITSFQPFHTILAQRIAGIDTMNPSSVLLAQRIAEDVTMIKIPADKILGISEALLGKMIDVQASDSHYVEQVLPLLQQADAGLKSQIADYRKHGELSDDVDDQLDLIGADGAMTKTPDRATTGTKAEDLDPAIGHRALHADGRRPNGRDAAIA